VPTFAGGLGVHERTSVGLDVHARSIVTCAARLRCEVVAPSKTAVSNRKPVKTDANDALHLARLLQLDEITSIQVPSIAEEAARDLVRARDDVRGELMRARHRVSKLLLRQGIVYSDGRAWTLTHHAWLQRQSFEQRGVQVAFDITHEEVLLAKSRRDRLDRAITEMAHESEWARVVPRLQCLRGVSTLTAFSLAVEIGDWERFTGSSIGASLGLVPTENSSGERRSQGSITKAGNTHTHRLLVEAGRL
jgi:transposase